MWDFEFSTIGTVVLIAILALSLFAMWIYGANVRSSASKHLLNLNNNAVRIAKTSGAFKGELPVFTLVHKNILFWRADFQFSQKKLRQPIGAFLSDSVYHCANAVFLSFLYSSTKDRRLRYDFFDLFARVFLTISIINIAWSALFGAWILVACFFALVVVLLILDLALFQKDINKAHKAAESFLIANVSSDLHKQLRAYVRYLPLYLLRKYAMAPSQPFVEIALFFWNVGRENRQV